MFLEREKTVFFRRCLYIKNKKWILLFCPINHGIFPYAEMKITSEKNTVFFSETLNLTPGWGTDASDRLFTKGVRLSVSPVILFSVRFTLFKVFQILENPVSPLVPCDARGETEAVITDPEFAEV